MKFQVIFTFAPDCEGYVAECQGILSLSWQGSRLHVKIYPSQIQLDKTSEVIKMSVPSKGGRVKISLDVSPELYDTLNRSKNGREQR